LVRHIGLAVLLLGAAAFVKTYEQIVEWLLHFVGLAIPSCAMMILFAIAMVGLRPRESYARCAFLLCTCLVATNLSLAFNPYFLDDGDSVSAVWLPESLISRWSASVVWTVQSGITGLLKGALTGSIAAGVVAAWMLDAIVRSQRRRFLQAVLAEIVLGSALLWGLSAVGPEWYVKKQYVGVFAGVFLLCGGPLLRFGLPSKTVGTPAKPNELASAGSTSDI
jgi:hypothetical protein